MKRKNMKISLIWNYLKNDKIKLFGYIFLTLISFFPQLITAFIWGKALEFLLDKNFPQFALYLFFYNGVLILTWGLIQLIKDRLYKTLEIKFMKNVMEDLFSKIISLPSKAFEKMGTGEFINRLSSDTDRIMELLSDLIKFISKMLVAIISFVIIFKVHVVLGIELIILALVMGILANYYYPKIKKNQEYIKKYSDECIKKATEDITGIREIKALGIKENIKTNIYGSMKEMFSHQKNQAYSETNYYALNNTIYFLFEFVILLTSGYYFYLNKLSYVIFMMVQTYVWRIDDMVESLNTFGVNLNKISVSLKRIDEIINNHLYKDEKFGIDKLQNCAGVIKFKNVSFKYYENEKDTLQNLNLTIEPNKKTAIVGRSGNGKSTIFNLLLRYFDATAGTITIDGINIENLTEKSLRSNISAIRQNPFLFNDTIKNNFKIVKKNVSLKEIREVCKKAYIDDYIMSLPKKYDTVIGEGGINLSGGQKQRIAIARTLLLNTKIILFDEATSALDNESQEYIKRTINELAKDHTIIIIAHRLSTIIDADVIHVINKGKLVSSGTFSDLMKTSKIFKNLYLREKDN